MGISKEHVVRALKSREQFFVAYAQATKLPYVTCDEESFNDQAWIFSAEEEVKAFGQKLLEEKIPLVGMRFEKKNFPQLYGILYGIGVNSIVWNENGEQMEVDLEEIARQPDLSKVEKEKRPLFNPTLQLSGIYFLQELRRPVKNEERRNMRELEEELIANIRKAEYLMCIDVNKEDGGKVNVPFLKDKKGHILQPVFTDVIELQKFMKNKKMRVLKIPFSKLSDLLIEQAEAVVMNPMGFNLVLNKEQIKKMAG
jgi:hypothetical protein